jgi:hypothetical protein
MVHLREKDFIPMEVNTSFSIGSHPPRDHVGLCSESFLLSPFMLPCLYQKPSKILVMSVDYPPGKGQYSRLREIEQIALERYQKDHESAEEADVNHAAISHKCTVPCRRIAR